MKYLDVFRLLGACSTYSKMVFGLGTISKAAYATSLHPPKAVYLTGGLGCAVPLALGMALGNVGRVVVVEGDGGLLHSPSTLVTLASYRPAQLTVIILENRIYGSTGGHPLLALQTGFDIMNVLTAMDFHSAKRATTKRALGEFLKRPYHPGPDIIVARIDEEMPDLPSVPNPIIKQSFELHYQSE